MSFKTDNKNVDFGGTTLPVLEPGIYERGTIVAVKKGTKTYNEEVTATIDIVLANEKGEKHVSQEKSPEEDKQSSFFEKMLHVLSSFMDKKDLAKAVKTEIGTFEELQDWLIKLHADHYPKDHKVDFKIEGSVYSGNIFVRLPNFNSKYSIPFIKSSTNKEIVISFTNSELKNLAKYKQAKEGNTDSAPDMGGGATTPDKPGF